MSKTELYLDLHAAASSYAGQGVSVRGCLHYLTRRSLHIRLLDLSPGGGREGFVADYSNLETATPAPESPGAWLHVGGGGEISRGTIRHLEQAHQRHHAAAYQLWWELPVIGPDVVATLERFDVVIAATQFIADVARRHLHRPAILYAPQPLAIAELPRPTPNRERFGIPTDSVAVLCGFDPSSDLARKNPQAALAAFLLATSQAPMLSLVIKLMLPRTGAEALRHHLEWLMVAAASNPRIRVIEEALSDNDLHTLMASCDAYLSLHRAEGLGLGMLEAMHLGLPVVATAYSGNMSFMDETSACLVPFDLVPVQGTSLPTYADVAMLGPTWAEPDVAAAAAHLVRLGNDPAWRIARGRAAADAAAAYQREAVRLEWLDELTRIAQQYWAQRTLTGRIRQFLSRLRPDQ
jgi:glycosyltransferase involved in cell wall biosynthesis